MEDDFAVTEEDVDTDERRFVTLGLSSDTIRMISAWKANKRQRTMYEEGLS